MDILHLIDGFDARFERDQIKLVEMLEKRGHSNKVITSCFSSDWRFRERGEFEEWERRFVKTEIFHRPSLRIPTLFSKMLLPVYLPPKQILDDFDIVHAYSFGTYSSFLAAAVKIVKRSKLVISSDLSSAAHSKAKNAFFYRWMTTYPFRMADAVYAYSNQEKRWLVDLGVQEEKIWIIPPGIDYGKFSKIPAVHRRGDITIGYLGRFCAVKGVHRVVPTLCTILRNERKVRVMFTGLIEDAEYARRVISPLQKFRNFNYVGSLSMLPVRFYQLCDIVLIPSTSETGAIAVLEAMASGKVVIASDINPIKEYIQHGRTGFLFRHEEEVCSYLKRLIGSPDLIMEIGTRASESTKKYDWQLLIRKYEEMYESVVAQKARDRP